MPVKDARSRRWYVSTACGDFEILTTGPKVVRHPRPARAAAVPSIWPMHLLQMSFVDAVKLLSERGRPRG